MRTSKLFSKKKIELFRITTNLQFQSHIVLLLFLHCRFFVNLCSWIAGYRSLTQPRLSADFKTPEECLYDSGLIGLQYRASSYNTIQYFRYLLLALLLVLLILPLISVSFHLLLHTLFATNEILIQSWWWQHVMSSFMAMSCKRWASNLNVTGSRPPVANTCTLCAVS